MTSAYQNHKKKWSNCKRCDLCLKRYRVVLLRGSLPCDVLLVGEAPGASEDVAGKPFWGPAGHLLNKMLQVALPEEVTYAITNLVGCIPKVDSNEKIPEPPEYAIEACIERLAEVIVMASPRLIVTLGKLAKAWLPAILDDYQLSSSPLVDVIHPAAILRMDISQQGLAIQRSIVTLQEAVAEIL